MIRFEVVSSPASNDFCLRAIVDGEDFIAKHWPELLGIDPPRMYERLLRPLSRDPRELVIARCGCGEECCDNASVLATADGGRIRWEAMSGGAPSVEFDAAQFQAALSAVMRDASWEPRGYTVDRLLKDVVDRDLLLGRGYEYRWASDRIAAGELTLSLKRGDGQVLVRLPWKDETPEEMTAAAARLLTLDPGDWDIRLPA